MKRFCLPVLFFVGLLSCHNNTPCTTDRVADCFVTPSSSACSSCLPDPDSLLAAEKQLRAAAKPGIFSRQLADSSGLPYHLGFSTPEPIRADTLYPLIIYLHGGTGTRRIDKGDSAFFMLLPLADTFDLFLASPSANRSAPWWSSLGLYRILQTLRYMSLHYPVDPDKVFLAGVSDGATGCYAAANAIPAPFAGFIAVSGFGGMLPRLGITLYAENLIHRPIYNVNAGQDRLYPIDKVEEFVALLKGRGIPITSMTYPEEEHGFDYRKKEMGALANLIRTWECPRDRNLSWSFLRGYPNLPPGILDWTVDPNSASLQGVWRDDTLIVRAVGVESLTLAIDDDKTSLFYRTTNRPSPSRELVTREPLPADRFPLVVRGGFPSLSPKRLVSFPLLRD